MFELCIQALREFDYYADTRKLRITVSNMKNANSREQLEAIKTMVLQNLGRLNSAPGAAIAPVPAQHPQVTALAFCSAPPLETV